MSSASGRLNDRKMSRIIVVAAIEIELAPFIARTKAVPDTWSTVGKHQIWVSFTGVGPVGATYHIQRLMYQLYPDMIVQAGLGGCYENSGLEVGQTVQVVKDRLADLGVMLDGKFADIFPENREIDNPHRFPGLTYPEVAGFTVNTGCAPIVPEMQNLFHNDEAAVETMEGYSLFYVCRQTGVPFLQLRTISNKVAQERSSWNIPLSTKNMANELIATLEKI